MRSRCGKEGEMSFKVIETQEQLDAILGERIARVKDSTRKEFDGWISPDELESKTSDLTKQIGDLNNALSSANEKIAENETTIAEQDKKIKAHEISSVKMRIANENGLSFEAMSFLQGEDEESIKASAESLKSLVNKPTVSPLANNEPPTGNSKDEALRGMLKDLE